MQQFLGRGQAVKALGFDPSIPRFESWRPSHYNIDINGRMDENPGLTNSPGANLNSTPGAGPKGVGHGVRSNPGAPAIFINHY